MRGIILGLFLAMLAVSTASAKKEKVLRLDGPVDQAVLARFQAAWPAVERACPGLVKYSSSWEFEGVRQCFYTTDGQTTLDDGAGFTIRVAADGSTPAAYKVGGHTCYFCIHAGDREMDVSKTPCESLCTDTVRKYDGKDLVLPLK